MGKAYRYVKTVCSICQKRHTCYGYRRIERNEAIDYGTLKAMSNCSHWDPEKKEKEGDQ